jgi:DNA-binding NarL/FixJ family response regulator
MKTESPLKILLVEDNSGDVFLFREYIRASEVAIALEVVSHLQNAFVKLNDHAFDAILLDLSLPDSQGIETFDQLHKTMPDIPLIILTGNDDENLAIEAVKKGAQDYLVKNQTSGGILLRAIRHAIERHHLQQSLTMAQQQLLKTERLRVLMETAGAAAHEINQPLTAILGYTELLLYQMAKDHPWRVDLNGIREACKRIQKIVQKMNAIQNYETKTYIGDTRIVDLDASASKNLYS